YSFYGPSFGEGNDRTPRGMGFNYDNAKILFAWKDQSPAPAQILLQNFVWGTSNKGDVLLGALFQVCVLRSVSDNQERSAQFVKGIDSYIKPFVRHQFSDGQIIVCKAARSLEARWGNRWIDDNRFSMVILLNPVGYRLGVGNVVIHTHGS